MIRKQLGWYRILRFHEVLYGVLVVSTTVKMLAAEINSACDAYISRKISADELQTVIWHYAKHYPKMLFNAQDLNSTVLNRIGKKRALLVNKMLEGYQYRL